MGLKENNRGIILHSTKYGENGVILYMLTETFGRMSYFLRMQKSGKITVGKNTLVIQPFSVINFVETLPENGAKGRIVEAKRAFMTVNTVFDIRKSTIAMFLSEFLYKVVKEQSPNSLLFDYIYNSIMALDMMQDGVANFHIHFLIKLSLYMGIYPKDNYSEGNFFDLMGGKFTTTKPIHDKYTNQNIAKHISSFMSIGLDNLHTIKLSREERISLLNSLVTYYELHHSTHYNIKSIEIMSELF